MDFKSSPHHKIVAVVAAFNEAARISEVLSVLTTYHGFSEIIVVNDGSTDDTSAVVRRFDVRLISLQRNGGKGKAMALAAAKSDADILFFCDADVKGLTHRMIAETIAPVALGHLDMMIAMRNRTIYNLRFILRFIPLLGGERAVSRELWEKVPQEYKDRFMIEAALNYYAYQNGGYDFIVFPGLSQTIKEIKYGIVYGGFARVKMFIDVIRSQIRLRLKR